MNPAHDERRRTSRYSISALAVLKTPKGPEVCPAQVADLSLAGSRVRVDRPLEPDQEFVLIIKTGGEEIVTRGTVAYWHPAGFAGLSFARMSDEARTRLERLVENLPKSSNPPESGSPG